MTIVMLMDKPDRTVGSNKNFGQVSLCPIAMGGDRDNYALEVAKLLTSPEIAKNYLEKYYRYIIYIL